MFRPNKAALFIIISLKILSFHFHFISKQNDPENKAESYPLS